MTCGWEQGPPIGSGYAAPFRCTGVVHRVTVDVLIDPERPHDLEADLAAIIAGSSSNTTPALR